MELCKEKLKSLPKRKEFFEAEVEVIIPEEINTQRNECAY